MITEEKKKLTLLEIDKVYGLYNKDPNSEPLILEQLQYINADHLFKLCRAYDMHFIAGTEKRNWRIERDLLGAQIFIRNISDKGFSYWLDTENGNLHQSVQGRTINTGCNAQVFQFYLQNNYAIKPYFESKHWACGKSLFDLNVAIPATTVLDKLLNEIFNQDEQKINDWQADKLFHSINLTNLEVYNDTITQLCQEHKLDLTKFL